MYEKFIKLMIVIKDTKFQYALKDKKLTTNNILTEVYKDMIEKPEFEQDYWSKTAIGHYKIGHDSKRILKWVAYYDRSCHENIIYYDLMGSLLKYLDEIS